VQRVRDEMKFRNLDELKKQLEADREIIRRILEA
jgi:FAD synthase